MPRGIKATKLTLSLPFGIGSIDFEPNDVQKKAAWSLYVELVSRISVQPMKENEGLLREALSSLYSVFAVTRQILKDAGPDVAAGGKNSVGFVALEVLNRGLRPVLTEWHPRLEDYEQGREAGVSRVKHERAWGEYKTLQKKLENLRVGMLDYATALGKIAGVDLPLTTETEEKSK